MPFFHLSHIKTLIQIPVKTKEFQIVTEVQVDPRLKSNRLFSTMVCNGVIMVLESLSKPRRRRQRERRQTKGLMSKTMAVHVRYKSLYISLPSSAKQQREMTKFCVVFGTRRTTANFSYLHLELTPSLHI